MFHRFTMFHLFPTQNGVDKARRNCTARRCTRTSIAEWNEASQFRSFKVHNWQRHHKFVPRAPVPSWLHPIWPCKSRDKSSDWIKFEYVWNMKIKKNINNTWTYCILLKKKITESPLWCGPRSCDAWGASRLAPWRALQRAPFCRAPFLVYR